MVPIIAKLGRWLREENAAGDAYANGFSPPVSVLGAVLFYCWLPRTRYLAAWVLALVLAGMASYCAWYDFYKEHRADKNDGHIAIDFGGQYLMGRMLRQGYGKELYFRERQREVLEEVYPQEDQDPDQKESDVEHLMSFTMGDDHSKGERSDLERSILARVGEEPAINPPHIGGPLYPPINAFLSYPMAWLRPSLAYRINQGINLLLAFLAALAVNRLAHGQIWWPVAACFVIVFPGFVGSYCLGQNATLTLNILLWGWLLMSRDRPWAGGIVWGLLAFKPVWLLSFLLVPLLTRRWRVALAMLGTAAVLALATLPFVGVHSWLDWLRIGHEAAVLYDTDENWIFMSRDLYSIPRRWMLHFGPGEERLPEPATWWTQQLDICIPFGEHVFHLRWDQTLSMIPLAFVVVATAGAAIFRRNEVAAAKDGPLAAFVLLGAWMSCYHFMYYDVLLAALPVCLLFTEPRRYIEPAFVGLWLFWKSVGDSELANYYRPGEFFQPRCWLPYVASGRGQLFLVNSLALSLVAFLFSIQYVFPSLGIGVYLGPPSDTYVLIVLWLWCGFRVLRENKHLPVDQPMPETKDVNEDGIPAPARWDDACAATAESARAGMPAEPL